MTGDRADGDVARRGASIGRRAVLASAAVAVGAAAVAADTHGTTHPPAAGLAGDLVVDGSGTDALQAAVDAVVPGGVVRLPAGSTHEVSTVSLPDKDLILFMYGANINTVVRGTAALVQRHRRRLTVLGGTFSGVGDGLSYHLPPSTQQSYDLAASGVNFGLSPDATAVSLNGVREATLTDCFFDRCTGVYLSASVNTHLVGCQFRDCVTAVHADGSNKTEGFDAGLMITACTMLGCGYGVRAIAWQWVSVVNAVIDYCDRPIVLGNVDTASIDSSYMSNRNFSSMAEPVINVVTDATLPGANSQHIRISGSQIISHASETPNLSVGIRLAGVQWCSITYNSVHFWQKHGIHVDRPSSFLQIIGNVLTPISGGDSPSSVHGTDGSDATWIIVANVLGAPITGTSAAVLRDNV